jgi:dihydroxy-acid dehydratase
MSHQLRSNLEPGTSRWAVRRAQWRALGLSDEDMEKPKIAVVNSSSELAICFSHLDGVAARAKEAIRAAGGVPFEVRTVAPSDMITSVGRGGAYILPSRDLVANDIEVQVEGAMLDGMVCLASCDKTVPGQLMAAARLDIPTIVVVCGYQQSGVYRGEHIDIEDVFLKASYVTTRPSVDELKEMSDNAICSPGVCAGMGTANSMHIACEALGMSLPGSAPVQAASDKLLATVEQAGARIIDMIWEELNPRDILTEGAFANATMAVLALSGSINCVKHLQAVAFEAGLDLDVYQLFADYAERVPLLASIRPSGAHLIEDLEAAGGAQAVLKRLEHLVDRDARTVGGQTLGEILDATTVERDDIVRTVDDPWSRQPSIIIVRGSLLPGGGIVRLGGSGEDRIRHFRGPATVFPSREEALEAIRAGRIAPGDVLVLRGLGVQGGPGMAFTSAVVFALDGTGLIEEVAVITEGQVSGLVNRGLVVGEASPEAAAGGPLALVEDGDTIEIDVDRRTVDLHVPETELAARRAQQRTFGAAPPQGWLGQYQRLVQPVHKGAVLDPRARPPA